jgi:DNA-binding cell septation regulator SpoVG
MKKKGGNIMKDEGLKIWVSGFRPLDKGSLKAFADVTIGEITIKGFRVVHKDLVNSGPWVGFPQIRFEKDGKPTFRDVIEASRQVRREISEKILEEYYKNKSQMEKVPF